MNEGHVKIIKTLVSQIYHFEMKDEAAARIAKAFVSQMQNDFEQATNDKTLKRFINRAYDCWYGATGMVVGEERKHSAWGFKNFLTANYYFVPVPRRWWSKLLLSILSR